MTQKVQSACVSPEIISESRKGIRKKGWKDEQKALRLEVDILKTLVSRMGNEAVQTPWKGTEKQAALEILNLFWHICRVWVQS